MGDDALALDFLQSGAQILPARFDRAKERWKGQASDVGISGTLALAHHAVFKIGKLAFRVQLHAVERRHPAFQLVDSKASQADQCVSTFHDPSPFPGVLPMIFSRTA